MTHVTRSAPISENCDEKSAIEIELRCCTLHFPRLQYSTCIESGERAQTMIVTPPPQSRIERKAVPGAPFLRVVARLQDPILNIPGLSSGCSTVVLLVSSIARIYT